MARPPFRRLSASPLILSPLRGSTSRISPLVLYPTSPSTPHGRRRIHSTAPRLSFSDSLASWTKRVQDAVEHERSEMYEGRRERGLRMLVFGKPGSGKGTLSARLVKMYDIAFVSTGDVLRKEIAAKSEVGIKAEEIVKSGGLVSDELMLDIVKSELDRLRGKSWIIDGFPRTVHQGKLLDDVLNAEGRPLNMIVHLNVPDSVIMARIAARWVHLPSGRVYNTTYSAPKVEGIDDITGEPLTKRPDDTPEVFSKRLKAYYESTAPLLEFFTSSYPKSFHSLSGSTSDEVLCASGFYPSAPLPPRMPAPYLLEPDYPESSPSVAASASVSSSSTVDNDSIRGRNESDAQSSSVSNPHISTSSSASTSLNNTTSDANNNTNTTTTIINAKPPSTYTTPEIKNMTPDEIINDTTLLSKIPSPPHSSSPSSSSSSSTVYSPTSGIMPESYKPESISASTRTALDQLWPKLQALVEPFGLKRRVELEEGEETKRVREGADDLKGPGKGEHE